MKDLKPFSPVLIILAILGCLATPSYAQQLSPPEYQVKDRMGINVTSGQVVVEIDTLTIGGERGLSHKVASYSSNFIQQNAGGAYVGIYDMYFGAAVYTKIFSSAGGTRYRNVDAFSPHSPGDHFRDTDNGIWVMRVHDHLGSQDFKVIAGGYARGYFFSDSGSYVYEALRDKRHKLEIPAGKPGHLLWTKPDGTQTWFLRGLSNITARTKGYIEKIVYPNGFTIYVTRNVGNSAGLNSIETNTGFQLKYNYVFDNTVSYGVGSGNTWSENPPESNSTWTSNNAKSIVGLNTAIERCTTSQPGVCVAAGDTCPAFFAGSGQSCTTLGNAWPTASFSWPKGMPRALFFGENKYTAKDAAGRTTEVNLKAFDKYLSETGTPISSQPAYPVGKAFVPRIQSIKPAGSSVPTVSYTFKNYPEWITEEINWKGPVDNSIMPGAYSYSIPGETALVLTATGVNGSAVYDRPRYSEVFPNPTQYVGADGITVKSLKDIAGGLLFVRSIESVTTFYDSYRNLPAYQHTDLNKKEYRYDDRGNLIKIITHPTESGTNPATTVVEADYPDDGECTNPKTCNRPNWISDAKSNRTLYTYHEASGQVATVTQPPNERGIAAQIRYGYEQHYAQYLNHNNQKVPAQDPIWLKTSERYCVNSAYLSGSCAAADEVVKTFQYDSDNLFLTSVTVSDPGTGQTQTTCYEYDIYGNTIGKTSAKGACN